MKKSRKRQFNFLNFIVNWPKAISILEIFFLVLGVASGYFLYHFGYNVANTANNAHNFDIQTRKLLLAISLANAQFNDILDGDTTIDIQRDVYSQLDVADSLCSNIDMGGPGGVFVPTDLPTPETIDNRHEPSESVCSQLSNFRLVIEKRWQDYIDGKVDTREETYEIIYKQILESIKRYEGVADPMSSLAQLQNQSTDTSVSIGIGLIFASISLLFWRIRKIRAHQTALLENEIENRKSLNQTLEYERTLITTLIDNIPDAVYAKNDRQNFIISNPATVYMMGAVKKEELLGKNESAFQPDEIASRILSEEKAVLEKGETILNKQEVMMDMMSGSPRWRLTTKVPLRDQENKITGLVGISRDITRQKETEEALLRANEKLTAGISALEVSSLENEHLSEMVDLLQACPNTEEACIVVADQMKKFFPKDSGMLYLFHPSRTVLDRAAAWGDPLPDSAVFKPDDCWGLRRGRMHTIQNRFSQGDSDQYTLVCPHIVAQEPADYLCVPLVAQGEAIGLLHLHHRVELDPDSAVLQPEEWYNHNKRQRIHTIVDSLSLALANLKLRSTLREQSIRDPLTSLFNRRYMEEILEREILRATRSNTPVSVIMLDIDHFKRFNDTFGHPAGDTLLSSLGKFLKSNIRAEDIACRYGGEEFLLLLPGANLKKAAQRAEELREKVRFLNIVYQGQPLGKVTLSFGVASFPQHGSTPLVLVQAVDQALYRAKEDGRDRVCQA